MKKVNNWRELPVWLKYVIPAIAGAFLTAGIIQDNDVLRSISIVMLMSMGVISLLFYTHETRKKTMQKVLIICLSGALITSLSIIYFLLR